VPYLYHTKQWIGVGADALEAQRQRNVRLDEEEFERLRGTAPMPKTTVEPISGKTPMTVAAERYFSNLEARGVDPKSIRTYRTGVDPFVENCDRTYVEDMTKQDMIDFMGSVRHRGRQISAMLIDTSSIDCRRRLAKSTLIMYGLVKILRDILPAVPTFLLIAHSMEGTVQAT
jgi:hypothetical protein